MVGIEMVTDRGTKEPDGAYVGRLMAETQRRGLITVSCGVITTFCGTCRRS
jgi:4-aminobutyrate aminotransferase-like enzyme